MGQQVVDDALIDRVAVYLVGVDRLGAFGGGVLFRREAEDFRVCLSGDPGDNGARGPQRPAWPRPGRRAVEIQYNVLRGPGGRKRALSRPSFSCFSKAGNYFLKNLIKIY